jgi:poly(A) polymerase
VLGKQRAQLAIPHRVDAVMKEIWLMQLRLDQRTGQRPFRLLEQPRFRAGYDFLLLRSASGEADQALGLWWGEFQDANLERRAEMLQPESTGEKKRRRRKPRKKPETGVTSESAE